MARIETIAAGCGTQVPHLRLRALRADRAGPCRSCAAGGGDQMNARLIIGDVFDVMAKLPDASVDLVCTSPPFLALRSYLPSDHPDKSKEIGSEPTPAAFLDTMLALTAEWGRLLAPHGSIAVELGDTYSGSGGAGGDYAEGGLRDGQPAFKANTKRYTYGDKDGSRVDSEKSDTQVRNSGGAGWPIDKSLCLIPQLYAVALSYGINPLTGEASPAGRWRVRNVVRWCRPNPPVGALGDKFRPATSEMVIATRSRTRYFDLDAVREPVKHPDKTATAGFREDGSRRIASVTYDAKDSAGAPPLDWWEIPTHPTNEEETSHRVRVRVDAAGGGIQRTTSPDCPVHGSQDLPGSSAPDGGREADGSSRTGRTDDRPARGPAAETLPMFESTGQPDSTDSRPGPAAMCHSSASSKTGRARSTSPAGTPCVETPVSIDGTSASPESSAPRHGTPSSSTGGAETPGSQEPRSAGRIAGKSGEPESCGACTCSYWVEGTVTQDTSDYATYPPDYWNIPTFGFKGSHYATWPPDLLVRPIKSMVPERVCRVCGEPSRRIVEQTAYESAREATGAPLAALGSGHRSDRPCANPTTVGWSDCGHDDYRPGVVLDPFAGSGTTLMVATGHGRDAIGIDLDARNADLARERVGMFLEVEVEEGAA